LRNAFFIYENDSDDITIRYNDTLQPLYQKEEITLFLQDKEQQLAKLVEEQKYLTALDDLNISTINKVKIQELEDQIWVLKAYTLFALDPTKEAQWN
ncbi:MSC_0621 family F1-like ATPase epsilon subunit, partial [Mycoplasma nasistruthionis]|uniref:MSC_0621 family F1-like ATPase epsilon subunit n=1 Tax=Mycoplasma nasistruthionis TaxID=353852 RepID=UPI001ABF0512